MSKWTVECVTRTIEYWCVAFAEMLFASVTLEVIFGHAVTLFWAITTTVVIFFTNKLLKKHFK